MNVQCVGGGLQKMQLRVLHLDDTIQTFQLSVHACGQELFAAMIDRISLLESDYFDLEYINEDGFHCWLDRDKPILRQLTPGDEFIFRFSVKFYAPFPNLLEEDLARYLFALQIKRDLVTGTLLCSENTAALLASYIVQAEIGDFIDEEYRTIDYLRPLKLLHETSTARLKRIREYHKAHIGLSPSEADTALLDTARKVEFYGIRLHFVRNHEGIGLNVAVNHQGILVYKNLVRVNTFSWAAVRKLSFKRKRFLLKLQPDRYESIEFIFDSRDECKQFWKNCIEHHSFFRCPTLNTDIPPEKRIRSRSASGFRYTGRTQQELSQYVQEHSENVTSFERPSIARRAYSTILSGSSYATRKFTSMQLRSKSADRRPPQSSITTLPKPAPPPRKRAQSDGAKTESVGSEQAVVVVDVELEDVDADAPPTSGYATMAESGGSGPSSGPNTTVEPDATNEREEVDTMTWLTDTYGHMTQAWTDLDKPAEVAESDLPDQQNKHPSGSPKTSAATVPFDQMDSELAAFMTKQNEQTFSDPLIDQLTTHLLVFGDLPPPSGLQPTEPEQQQQQQQLQEPQGTTDTGQVTTSDPRAVKSTQNLLSDLTRSVFLSDPNMGSWIGWLPSPIHEQTTFDQQGGTLPALAKQADATVLREGEDGTRKSTPAIVDWLNGQEQTASSIQYAQSESSIKPIGMEKPAESGNLGLSTFGRGDTTTQAFQPSTGLFDDFSLPVGKTLFFLPTMTQYGINLGGQEAEITQEKKSTEVCTQTSDDPTVNGGRNGDEHAVRTSKEARPNGPLTVALTSATEYDSPFSPNVSSAPLTRQTTSKVSHHSAEFPHSIDAHSKSQRSKKLIGQSRDRWSSSGSDSAGTGVIHRPEGGTNPDRPKRQSHPLPNLPLDTLPTRSSHKSGARSSKHTQSLSRSAPQSVHLSGLSGEIVFGRESTSSAKKTANPSRPRRSHRNESMELAHQFPIEREVDQTGMMREVPYVVLQRPPSVDVKKYQLHLQRQQQQAAALAAAGYPFNPAPPFYPDMYQFPSRMPGYPPMVPSHRCAMPKSEKQHSAEAAKHYMPRMYPVNPMSGSDHHHHHHEPYRMKPDMMPVYPGYPTYGVPGGEQEALSEKEKRRARRRQLKSQAGSVPPRKEPPHLPFPSQATPLPPPGMPGYDPRLHHQHHLHCSHQHENRITSPKMAPADVVAGRAIARARRVLRPQKATDPIPGTSGKKPRSKERDESREAERPYPVSEVRSKDRVVSRMVKADSTQSAPRHQHHPACASLIGRTRIREQAKPSGDEAEAAAAGRCRVHRAHQMHEQMKKRSEDQSDKQSEREKLKRQQEIDQGRTKHTPMETIEQLQQDLRTAGFQIAVSPRTSIKERKKTSTKPSEGPSQELSSDKKRTTEHASPTGEQVRRGSREKPTSRPSPLIKRDYDGMPENPIYLESDTDSERVEEPKPTRPTDKTTVVSVDTATSPINLTASELETVPATRVMSPTSHSPSLPLSFAPSEGDETSLHSSQPSFPSSIGSKDAPLVCPRCDWCEPYEDTPPHFYCHAQRHHSACRAGHYKHWHDPYECCHHHHVMERHRAHSVHHRRRRDDSSPSDQRRRAKSDKRTTSHRQRSSVSSESSASQEFSDAEGVEEFEQSKLQIVLDKLLAHERQLREQLEKHRKLTSRLKQVRRRAGAHSKRDELKKLIDKEILSILDQDGGVKVEKPGKSDRQPSVEDDGPEHSKPEIEETRQSQHHHRVSTSKKTTVGKHGSHGRKPQEKSHRNPEAEKAKVDEANDLIIANQVALTEAESDKFESTVDMPSTSRPIEATMAISPNLSTITQPLEVITEAVASDEVVVHEPIEEEAESECKPTSQSPPQPPSEPPPRLFYGSSLEDEEKKTDESEQTQGTDEQQPTVPLTSQELSSVNHLSHQSPTDLPSDADSEYNGTRAIGMLTEVIDNAMREDFERRDSMEGARSCTTNEDSHTSEASVETVRAAVSPRPGSPSSSTTSASEGSEEIEPFPPPPPPQADLDDMYVGSGTLTHSTKHLFPSSLDEVIEEETYATELDATIQVEEGQPGSAPMSEAQQVTLQSDDSEKLHSVSDFHHPAETLVNYDQDICSEVAESEGPVVSHVSEEFEVQLPATEEDELKADMNIEDYLESVAETIEGKDEEVVTESEVLDEKTASVNEIDLQLDDLEEVTESKDFALHIGQTGELDELQLSEQVECLGEERGECGREESNVLELTDHPAEKAICFTEPGGDYFSGKDVVQEDREIAGSEEICTSEAQSVPEERTDEGHVDKILELDRTEGEEPKKCGETVEETAEQLSGSEEASETDDRLETIVEELTTSIISEGQLSPSTEMEDDTQACDGGKYETRQQETQED